MPTLKLTGASAPAKSRKSPAKAPAKSPARKTPARKPAAKQTPARTSKATPKRTATAPAPTQTSDNGGTRSPRLPDGWSKADFNRAIKDMHKFRTAREAAAEKLAEAQAAANGYALELLKEGVQMSVVSAELDLSRQWLYTLMENNGLKPARSRSKPAARSSRTTKPAAKKRPAAKAAAKPAAKRSPARKRPAAKAPAVSGRGRVRLSR